MSTVASRVICLNLSKLYHFLFLNILFFHVHGAVDVVDAADDAYQCCAINYLAARRIPSQFVISECTASTKFN